MKMLDLLTLAKQAGNIIVNPKYKLGAIYSEKHRCFVWCYKDGKLVENSQDPTGYHRVILSPKLTERGDWYLDIAKSSEKNKDAIYFTENGVVIDGEDFCRIIKTDTLGNRSLVEINKRKGTIVNKDFLFNEVDLPFY